MSDNDPPGLNAPRRKARFRSQYDDDVYRRVSLPKRGAAGTPPPPTTSQPAPEEADANATGEGTTATSVDDLPPETAPGQAGGEGEGVAAEAAPAEEENDLLPNFRLNKVYEARPPQRSPFKDWRWLSVTALLLTLGLAGGYALGVFNVPVSATNRKTVKQSEKVVLGELSPEVQAQVDAAFEATKKGRYKDANGLFAALHKAHPEWWSMGIESARAALYFHDVQEAQNALKGVTSEQGLPDADFIMALLHLTNKELELAETSFATAVARDPARPDFYYFWGECLRRDGKPREAVGKFRSALLRNQYENSEGLYQVKLWLSQIQADQEESSGANKEIDASLAAGHPTYEALLAAAAREMKGKRYQSAAGFIARAQAVTEPAVFRVIMQDPTFLEESANHAELAGFYR